MREKQRRSEVGLIYIGIKPENVYHYIYIGIYLWSDWYILGSNQDRKDVGWFFMVFF